MSKQKQSKEIQADHKRQQKVEPPVSQMQGEAAELAQGSFEAPQVGAVGSQAAMLKRMAPAQAQAMLKRVNRTQGNQHAQRVVAATRSNTPAIQAQLSVSEPGDEYEREADTVAEQVMTMSAPSAPSAPDEEDTSTVNRLPISRIQASGEESPGVSPDVESRIDSMKGGGKPIPADDRGFFEERMGADFSNVRVHTDSGAAETSRDLDARAYTVGSDIAFNSGEYEPGTDKGKRLLAHELTHVVQQGGAGELQRKVDQAPSGDDAATKTVDDETPASAALESAGKSEPAASVASDPATTTTATDSGRNGAGLASAESSKLESPASVQAPATPEPEASAESPTDVESEDRKPESATPESEKATIDAETSLETKDEQAAESPKGEIQIVAPAPSVKPIAEDPKAAEIKANPPQAAVAEQIQALDQQSPQVKGEQAKADEKQAKGEDALAGVAEAENLDKVDQDTTLVDMASEAGDQDSGELESQKEESAAQSEQAEATLAEAEATADNLAATEVDFALPEMEQEQNAPSDDELVVARQADTQSQQDWVAVLEEQRATARGMINSFVMDASGQAQQITNLAQQIPDPILQAAEEAKVAIQVNCEEQKTLTTTRIAGASTLAQAEAETLHVDIAAQHEASVSVIQATTIGTRESVETEYQTSLQSLNELEATQLGEINSIYTEADAAYREAGSRVADTTESVGSAKEQSYRSLVRDPKVDDSLLDGPLTDNRHEARADAARDTTQQYKQSLIDEANSQADQAQESKPDLVQQVQDTVIQYRDALSSHRDSMLDSLQNTEEQSVAQAEEMQAQLTQGVDQALQTTIESLKQQETAHIERLDGELEQRLLVIDNIAQQTTASMQQALGDAATQFLAGLQGAVGGLDGQGVPDPALLVEGLASALGQVGDAAGGVQSQSQEQLAVVIEQINAAAAEAIDALTGIGDVALEGIEETEAGFTTTTTELSEATTQGFTQIQETHTEMTTTTTETAVQGFQQTITEITTAFADLNTGVRDTFSQSITNLENGLLDALNGRVPGSTGLDALIEEKANEAASKVQPRWKAIVKWVLIIAVIVVAAILLGPFLVGALGALVGSTLGTILAGAIVGGLAAGTIQVVNNWYEGNDLLEGVGMAVLVGVIGGGLGAGVGLALQGPIQAMVGGISSQALGAGVRYAAETLVDFTLDIATELIIKGQLTWESVLTSFVMAVAMNGASRVPGVKNMTQSVETAGTNFGSNVRSHLPFGGSSVGTPDLPSTTTHDAPETITGTPEVGPQSQGSQMAQSRGYPDAPEGYHWAKSGNDVILRRNPNQASQRPQMRYDSDTGQFVPVGPQSQGFQMAQNRGYPDAPEGYHWAKNGDDVILKRNPNQASQRPPLKYDPSSGEFVQIPGQHSLGTVNGEYSYVTRGPLDQLGSGSDANNFVGQRYKEVELTQDVVLYRAGKEGKEFGQYFTQDPPVSEIQARVDSAVRPEWSDGAKSPIDMVYEILIPQGTKVYIGETANQGGFYMGGTEQIFVLQPWDISGVKVLNQYPIQK